MQFHYSLLQVWKRADCTGARRVTSHVTTASDWLSFTNGEVSPKLYSSVDRKRVMSTRFLSTEGQECGRHQCDSEWSAPHELLGERFRTIDDHGQTWSSRSPTGRDALTVRFGYLSVIYYHVYSALCSTKPEISKLVSYTLRKGKRRWEMNFKLARTVSPRFFMIIKIKTIFLV